MREAKRWEVVKVTCLMEEEEEVNGGAAVISVLK